MISGDKLLILYSYYGLAGDTYYVLEEVELTTHTSIRMRAGNLVKEAECSINLGGAPRSAAYSGGILVVTTDEGITAFNECKKLWEIGYPYTYIDGVMDETLHVHNRTTYTQISLGKGEIVSMWELPTELGGSKASYYRGKLLSDGTLTIEGLVPGQPFYMLIRNGTYELVPTRYTGMLAVK